MGPLLSSRAMAIGPALKALKQVHSPRLNHFRPMLQDLKFSFVRACDLQADIMFGIGPVKPNESRKLIRGETSHLSPPIDHD